ncbi:hypothetical protein H4S08_001263 [Coemansia sp. RSA 1365]|nr:hypothetical protein H4S08_001263 [Coemansia sp. RSA 1365]
MAVSFGIDSASNTISSDQATDASQSNNTGQTTESRRQPPVCRFFGQGQGCRAGDRCKFLHTQSVPSNQIDDAERVHRGSDRRGGKQGRNGINRQQGRVTLRKTQIDGLLRAPRWTVQRLSAKPGESAFAIEMEPSDPDFPFDVARLYLALVVPSAYPTRRTSDAVIEIQVANGDIPSGVKRNIESAFAKNARKSANDAIESGHPENAPSLEDHLQWLDHNLELLMQQKPAPTIKFTTFSNPKTPEPVKHEPVRRDNSKPPPHVVSSSVSGVVAMRPPVHRPVPQALQDSHATATESGPEDPRRALELRQLERRFRSSYKVVSDTASKGTIVRLDIAPTDPDMHSHDIFQITGTISVARTYPQQLSNTTVQQAAVSLSLDSNSILGRKNKPSTWQPVAGRERQLQHICKQFNAHVQEVPETSLLHHLNWLDRHMIGMLAASPAPDYPASKQTPPQVDPQDTEPRVQSSKDTSMTQMFSTESKKPWIREITATEAGLPNEITSLTLETANSDGGSDVDANSTDEDLAAEGGEGSATFAKPDRRGIELRFGTVQLSNVALAHCHSLNLSVRCERCKDTVELRGISATTRMTADQQKWQACSTCSTVVGVRFRPDWMFDGCSTLGFLDCAGCRPVDMLASKLTLTCDACATKDDFASAEDPPSKLLDTIGTVGIAAHAHFNCRTCYARMTVLLQEPVFERLQNGPAMGGGSSKTQIAKAVEGARGAKTRRREELALLGVVPGQPLPDHGSCKHFRRSQRWLRFPCCGKTYPCVSCHDDKEDHAHEYAQVMLCGHCAKEQSISRTEKSGLCIGCGAQVIRKVDGNHAFWQGGTGVRDRTRMSRKEGRKYQGLGKTVSQKNVTTPKK